MPLRLQRDSGQDDLPLLSFHLHLLLPHLHHQTKPQEEKKKKEEKTRKTKPCKETVKGENSTRRRTKDSG
jgi:hypothetical protein